ncbi:hypothetical protein [Ruegeria sp.]|uniref:hypothetical protein n=1 Tax=Ruegeria sp. TaxID=1879320 RepID=UPI002321E03C|nr:hypothetical protein [Ruegeria sp.]MDA7966389.1 hypothetical protein [Ruegeria sp.]
MSDGLVNTDTDDVLSSIKRLVSEGGREESEFLFIPTPPAKKPGRLVLTDALRVSDVPLAEEKPAPLKLTPADAEAANSSATPMRLTPDDSVPAEPVAEAPATPEMAAKRDLAGSLSAKIEALEAAIARTEDQWEPDGETNDAYSGTRTRSVNWAVRDGIEEAEDEEKTSATFIRHSDKAADADEAQSTAELSDDEEALRAFIAQIVREELQGALGERITRNLRKMVRREIYRALVAQKLE